MLFDATENVKANIHFGILVFISLLCFASLGTS